MSVLPRKRAISAVAVVTPGVSVGAAGSARAFEMARPVDGMRLQFDNDLFTGQARDRDYTGGITLTLSGKQARATPLSLDALLGFVDARVTRRSEPIHSFAAQQVGVMAFTWRMHPGKARRLVCAFAACALGSNAANAQSSDELRELVRTQAAQIDALDARLRSLEQQLAAKDSAAAAALADGSPLPASTPAAPAGGSAAIRWKGGPQLSSADGRSSAKLRGRVMSDAWSVSSSAAEVDYPSGTETRAARLGIEGRLNPVLTYRAEVDFSGEEVVLKDALLQFKGATPLTLTVGNFKPLFSLEQLTGLPRVTFMERGLPNVFALPESIGVAVTTHGDTWSAGVNAFGESPGTAIEGDEGYGAAARLSYAPLLASDRLIHLGVAGYYKHLGGDAGLDFRIRQRPESRIFSTRLVDTGANDAYSTAALGLELSANFGPFSVQSEYMRNRVDYATLPAASFDGAYAYAGWFLTGESRPYDATNGTIGRLKPRRAVGDGGWGALELALRFSTLDLSDGSVQGGSEDNVTFGINWYLSEYSRLMLNWVRFDVSGSTDAAPFGAVEHEGSAVGIRAQVDW